MGKDQIQSPPDFLVHDRGDSVGVVVVEKKLSGKVLSGWVMETDETIAITAIEDIPLGHKIALTDLNEGAEVIKYGFAIGRTVAPVRKGSHLHVHNTKTEKW